MEVQYVERKKREHRMSAGTVHKRVVWPAPRLLARPPAHWPARPPARPPARLPACPPACLPARLPAFVLSAVPMLLPQCRRESAPIIPSPTTGQRASTPRLAALCFRHFIKMQIRRYGDVRGSSSPPQRASRGLDRGVWISRRCVMLGCCAKCHSRFLHQLFPGLQCSSSLGEWATPLFGAETRVDIHASFDCAASSRDRARLPSPSAPPPSDANGGWLQSPGNVGRR
ncbi:uncharacterized protein LOC142929373 isoform X2 [Petromyzon marinus]|uniref:uncharacterized protein LOC142929373 isoform X2 n=1 Tax=Petromyzon marinus TaxID=7757 RepID=UPI003F72399D